MLVLQQNRKNLLDNWLKEVRCQHPPEPVCNMKGPPCRCSMHASRCLVCKELLAVHPCFPEHPYNAACMTDIAACCVSAMDTQRWPCFESAS